MVIAMRLEMWRAQIVPHFLTQELSGLVRLDGSGVIVSGTAWHWESSLADRRWAFYIRHDLYLPSTGERISAYDFEDLWDALQALPGSSGLPPAQARAVDIGKLVVCLQHSDRELPNLLALSPLRLPTVQFDVSALMSTNARPFGEG